MLNTFAPLVHTHPDNVAESEIFLHEPDFITQLAELVQPNKPVPMDVRTVALLALDTCCRVDNRVNDVTAALSVSVNHGTLMSILRKLSADLHSDHRKQLSSLNSTVTNTDMRFVISRNNRRICRRSF